MINYTPDEPIVAIATPLSPSALSLIRTSGKNCIELVSKIFSRPKKLMNAEGNTIVYGWIIDNTMTEDVPSLNKIDEVLVSVFRSPKSFTGEDMVEISCHGGTSVVRSIYKLLLKNGFREAERGEFTFRSYIHGKTDLTKAEAIREIIESKTDTSRSHATERLAGSLFEKINLIKNEIINISASIEVAVEYPEDEETIADSFDCSKLNAVAKDLQMLLDSWQSEKLFQDGVRVVLCGKTNAGKSSLFNTLLKEERAIVSDIAGTTRDFLESWVNFAGLPVRLFDTAGLRDTDDAIEKQGVALARSLTSEADVVLYLVDNVVGASKDDIEFLQNCVTPCVVVWNKCDVEEKNSALDGNSLIGNNTHAIFSECKVSAKTGYGISNLVKTVSENVLERNTSAVIGAGLGSARQKKAVAEAIESVTHALENAKSYTLDAVVQDLDDALHALAEVTGEVTPDDILDSVFSNFCVGK